MYRLCLLSILSMSSGLPTEPSVEPTVEKPNVLKTECSNGIFSSTCLKIETISLIEKLNKKDELQLLPGVTIVREESDNQNMSADFARHLGGSPYEKLDKYLFFSIGNYLDTHSVKLRLLSENVTEDARSLADEARGKKKKGGLGGILALLAVVKGTLMSVAIGALALLAGKALLAALMSLLLSAIIGVKSIGAGQKSTTYEIVSKPIYSHTHSHSTAHEDVGGYGGHAGYGRSLKSRRRR